MEESACPKTYGCALLVCLAIAEGSNKNAVQTIFPHKEPQRPRALRENVVIDTQRYKEDTHRNLASSVAAVVDDPRPLDSNSQRRKQTTLNAGQAVCHL